MIISEPDDPFSVAASSSTVNMSLSYADFINPIEQLDSATQLGSATSSSSLHTNELGLGFDSSSASNLRSNLPNEFQVIDLDAPVPLLQNLEDANQDFILICEFSEVQGPIPLITIPLNSLDKTDINLNTLSVHVMFTDYQVNTVGQFKVCEDTQVMRTNVFKNVHVFMQYFTLYDIKARGFVRPFCFGYITKDHVKLGRSLEKLIHHFNIVTSILKYSNRVWFKGELRKYLSKLNNAKENYPFIRSYTPPSSGETDFDGLFQQPTESYNSDMIDLDSCGDTISLQQIEHQFQEIGNIFQIIDGADKNEIAAEQLSKMKDACNSNPEALLSKTISSLNFIGNSFEELRLPFVHPLKRKDEALRPITILGQYGVLLFIQKLLEIHDEFKEDLLFSEMTQLTQDFEKSTAPETTNNRNINIEGEDYITQGTETTSENEIDEYAIDATESLTLVNGNEEEPVPSTSASALAKNQIEISEKPKGLLIDCDNNKINDDILNNIELCQIIEKLHLSVPIISLNDARSDSFVTLSDESGTTTPTFNFSSGENEGSSFRTAFGSVDSRVISKEDFDPQEIVFPDTISSPFEKRASQASSDLQQSPSSSEASDILSLANKTLEGLTLADPSELSNSPLKLSGSASDSCLPDKSCIDAKVTPPRACSSDEESPIKEIKGFPVEDDSTSVEIKKDHWWAYASKTNLQKQDPGYGLLKFFRHFHTTAHHLLYSILIGRPVIIIGKESTRHKILQIFNCLIPFVPCFPQKSFKLLQWHQGILVSVHFKNFKLIGLCLPERLTIHDLVSPHDLNGVTILDYETRKISGPAYSGQYFDCFTNPNFCLNKFFDDLSLLTFIGSILTDIESQVYMCKAILMENEEHDQYDHYKSLTKIMKQLSLKSSDFEIIKNLSNLLVEPNDCTQLF